jgi:hypothetical protein
MNKTRKIRNKKLFLKWLKKSHRNKHNIVQGGGEGGDDDNVDDDEESKKLTENEDLETSTDVGSAALTLGTVGAIGAVGSGLGERLIDMAYSLASNEAVINAISGMSDSILSLASNETVRNTFMVIATGTTVATAVATGGLILVAIAIGTMVAVKLKERYSKYYIFIQSINNYILLLRKIDTMVRVAQKISLEYKFVIDTKDVVRSLELLFNQFETLLSVEDLKEIKSEIVSPNFSATKLITDASNEASNEARENSKFDAVVDEESSDGADGMPIDEEAKKRSEGFLKKMKKSMLLKIESANKSVKKGFKNATESLQRGVKNATESLKKGVKRFGNRINQKSISKKIDKEVTKLGLYFSILLGELNIILNVCQMGIIGKSNFAEIQTANVNVGNDKDFKKMLVSSIIYRTLQLYIVFDTCEKTKTGNQIKEIKELCSPSTKKKHIEEIENERKKIEDVLYSKKNGKSLYPLYESDVEGGGNDPLQKLRDVMRDYKSEISDEEKATKFLNAINEFNEQLYEKMPQK